MNRTIYQYQPINTNPDKAIGITLPFNKPANSRSTELTSYASAGKSGLGLFNQSYSTEAQAISNLKNLLLTIKGERIMQPNFGSNILSLVFEQNVQDLATALEDTLTADINYWLPYIVINNIDILQEYDSYAIIIRLYFSVTQTGANKVINILASENSLVITEPQNDTTNRLVAVGTAGGL
jgi:phage baseplate assembly protein W